MSERRFDRRQLLGLGSVVGGGLALTGCEHAEDPYALPKPPVPGAASWSKGEERFVATSCAQCAAGCGIRVRVVEGRAVKVEGNTACPVNAGGVGPRGLSGPQVLYDPDRIRQPMRRSGARGASAFEPATWEQALDAIGAQLKSLREAGNAHRVGFVCGRERGMMLELFRRFARVYGTPNVIDGFSGPEGVVATACELMQGIREVPAYDWVNARYVLSLGSGILDASCQSVYFARSQGAMRQTQAGVRAKIVHAGYTRSRTATAADEWIAIRPGTHGAFALGLAHVLVRDALHDAVFVEQHGFGFEPWTGDDGKRHVGFREVVQESTPERVATVCDVAPRTLERIAHEMASARPSFAIAGSEELLASNGLPTAMAVHALNALLGAIDRRGGLLVQRDAPLAAWPDAELDEIATVGLAKPRVGSAGETRFPFGGVPLDALPDAVASGAEPLDALFLYYANPLYARPRQKEWRAALAKVPLVVAFTPFLDETAEAAADWILPDDSYLERFEDAAPAPSVGHAVFGVRQPVVERLYDTRATGDVLLQLAARIGAPVAEALPWKDFKDAVKQRVVGLYQAKRGSIVEDKGSTFLKRLYDEGCWSDPTYAYEQWSDVLKTPSGRFEFFSQRMARTLDELAARAGVPLEQWLASAGLPTDRDRVCMPAHDEMAWNGDAERFPVLLMPHRPSTYAAGSGANLPWLQELHLHAGRPTWETEVEMHTSTARDARIASGDRVRLESPNGEHIEAVAWVSDGVLPGIVRVAQGGGHTALGRFARGWGDNVMKLVNASHVHALAGTNVLCDTRVALRRIG